MSSVYSRWVDGLLKFLLDTNVVIPMESQANDLLPANVGRAFRFSSLAAEAGHSVLTHPISQADFSRDEDADRRALRESQLNRYGLLADPPRPTAEMTAAIGDPSPGTNDWVDDQLLAAVYLNAADFLVTEDRGIFRKARKLGIEDQVASLAEAIDLLLLWVPPRVPPTAPSVAHVTADQIPTSEPILKSLRDDYPEFDEWFARAQTERRPGWIVESPDRQLAGLALVKHEDGAEIGLHDSVLKISTFKVSEEYGGNRYGELLLKSVLEYVSANRYHWTYLTTFDKQQGLISFLEQFGFRRLTENERGELVFVKVMSPVADPEPVTDPVAYNVRYGPSQVMTEGVATYLVPVQPSFHRTLFPEAESQLQLIPSAVPVGHAIRKAYLCNSNISALEPGSILLFYRSQDLRAVQCVGIVERVLRSQDPNVLARFVGKRTVYSFGEIDNLCRDRSVLALLFRHAKVLDTPIDLDELRRNTGLERAPQSVTRLRSMSESWFRSRLAA